MLSLYLLLLCSCSNVKNDGVSANLLFPTDSFLFELDSVTPDYTHGLQVIKTDTADYLALLNDLTNTIYFYNLKNRQIEKNLSFHKGGDGIQNNIMSFFPYNEDSVFLMTHGWFCYLSDYNGRLLDRYSVLDLSFKQSPYATSSSPLLFRKDKLYYNSIVFGNYQKDYQPLMCYDIPEKSVSTFGALPPVYHSGSWGSFPYDYIYQVYDKNNDRIIYSFPASNELLSYDFVGDPQIVPESSSGERIKPPFEGRESEYGTEEWNSSINSTPIFGELYLNEDDGKLFRVYKKPAAFEDLAQEDPKREVSLLMYADDLTWIGEFNLSNAHDYQTTNAFFYEGKLFLRVKVEDEDLMKFVGYDLSDR